jgi:phage tail-like protein
VIAPAPAPVTAEPDPKGGAIRLAWTNPQIPNFAGTRLLRRETVWPSVPGDMNTRAIHDDTGTPAGADGEFLDTGLRDEVTYYYAVVSYDQTGGTFPTFVAAMSTAPYGTGQYLYDNLPGIYQSYDTARPPPSPALDPADLGKGQLQRFVEMFGLQFDLLRSYASGMRSFFNPDTIDGSLLPLLGGWIGWQTDFTLDLLKQRNQIRYAPHYHATTGIAANVRATINRLATWDVRIKEFAQNIFLSNVPEQFPIWQQERIGSVWQPAAPITLDVTYEGGPSAVQSPDGRLWLFYHARESTSANGALITAGASDRFHLRYKVFDQGDWLPARRLTMTLPVAVGSSTNRAPAAVLRSDGTFWIFWSSFDPSAQVSQLRAARMVAGRAALSARIHGTRAAPFALADGDTVQINIGAPQPLVRNVVFRREDFVDITQAAAFEVAAVLDRELPGVSVTAAPDGTLVLLAQTAGPGSLLTVPASTGAAKLGLASGPAGAAATAATLTGTIAEPFALAENDTLVLTIDRDVPRTVTFSGSSFYSIAQATASEVAAALNAVIPQAASAASGKLQIRSASPGADSMVLLDLSLSTAAAKLGLGQAPPPTPSGIDETEPVAFEDPSGNLWLFWASRRDGGWRIWYDRLAAGAGWSAPKPLTSSPLPEREPSALFDSQGGGRIWVAWSRRKPNGLWTIFVGGNTTLDFNAQASGGWPETELTAPAATFDNREPALALTAPGSLELFFSSNRFDGWNIWSRPVTATTQGADTAATSGQFSRRGAAPLQTADGRMLLWFRNNETIEYTSALYPTGQTIDSRYAGSTAADTRNQAKLSLRNDLDGIQHYTYETPLADADAESKRLYSRDTIALYLTPDTQDEQLIDRSRTVIANVLKSFLPAQTRTVILIDQAFEEFVYTYDAPAGATPQFIGEEVIDTVLSEVVAPFADSATASVNFRFLRTWAPNTQPGQLPDLRVVPPDLSFRLLLANVQEQP